jgi:hypothetical protein
MVKEMNGKYSKYKRLDAGIRTGIENLLHRIRPWGNNHRPHYDPDISDGRLVVPFSFWGDGTSTIQGLQIGNIIDSHYFVKEWFTGPQLEIASKFEDSTQQILKHVGPRKYSGLYQYSHIDRVAENTFNMAKEVDVPLDFVILLLIIGHDREEDDPKIRQLYDQWKDAVNIGDNERRETYGKELSHERTRVRGTIEEELLGYSSEITGIKNKKVITSLENDIKAAVNLISDITRFSDQRTYASSMDHQYHKVGRENIAHTLRRVIVKNSDRSSNIGEIGLLLPYDIMGQIGMAFNDKTVIDDYVVGEELRRRFGDIRIEERRMSNAIQVYTSFKSIFPLQYFNETRNQYATRIGGGNNKRTKDLLTLATLSTARLVQDSGELAESAFRSYEGSDNNIRKRVKSEVDGEIEALKQGMWYDRATLGGIVEYWLLNGQRGSRSIESLDKNPDQKAQIYRTARHLVEIFPRYNKFHERNDDEKRELLDNPQLYNPKKHDYFTLQNFDSLVILMQNEWLSRKPETNNGATLSVF